MFPLSDSARSTSFSFINIALIAFTVFVFLQQLITPDPEAFIYQYALVPALVDFTRFETLLPFVTSIFLHGGFLHILSNMWFPWVFGDNIEDTFGSFFYPFVYLASGIIGGLSQYAFAPDSPIPMLGASGAVAGVLGAYFVLYAHSKIKTLVPIFGFVTIAEIPAPFMLGYWFVLQFISGAISIPFISESGGVAFWAHVGGFLAGVVFAKLLRRNGTFHISLLQN